MKLEEFMRLFDNQPFVIRYIDRTTNDGKRKRGWHVAFSGHYFTTDSDRLCGEDYDVRTEDKGWGDTLEEALMALADSVELNKRRQVASGYEDVKKMHSSLEEFLRKRGEIR